MEPTLKTLKAALEIIRDMAINALSQIERPPEQHSMRWKCKECRYIKHFTKPVTLETAGRCPRCKSTEFKPILWATYYGRRKRFVVRADEKLTAFLELESAIHASGKLFW